MNKNKHLIIVFSAFLAVSAGDLYPTVQAQAKAEAGTAEPRAGEVWKEPMTGMEFVWIPSGKFIMGSNEEMDDEQPTHRVHIDGFWMGKYEVTQGQWKTVMRDNPAYFRKGDDYPVETVAWDDARAFIGALSAGSGIQFRLPTEAEWEYACRAGTSGWENIELGDVAWFNENSNNATHPVGQKKPNAWGLYDMLGNVWEWCQDWYGAYAFLPQVNPTGPETGSRRVIRGGSWSVLFIYARPLNRGSNMPSDRGCDLGFRLAISKDVSINTESKDDQGPLALAVSGGHKEAVESLIAGGAAINVKNKDGLTPLHLAVLHSRLEMAELLIAKGADINAKDQFGSTPLHEAVIQGPEDIIELLLAKGADFKAMDHNGSTPLHYAAKKGQKDTAARLIAKGADISAGDQFGDTPLHLAAQEGRKDVAELLIAKGADVNTEDKKGYTALRYAESKGHAELAALLRKHGAK